MLLLLLTISLALIPFVHAEPFTLAQAISNHAVLPAAAPLVWGFAAPSVSVAVSLDGGAPTVAVADAAGVWRAALPAQPPSLAQHTLSVSSAGAPTVVLSDVLFGLTILCAGQSNLALTVASAFNATAEIAAAAAFPSIRLLSQATCNASTEAADFCRAPTLAWSRAAPATVGLGNWSAFSALCWFTARDTFAALNGSTPIGAVVASYAGTSIQYWSDASAVAACAHLRPPTPNQGIPCTTAGNVSCLFNGMVHPLTVGPWAFSAVLWMQGEQDTASLAALQAGYYRCALGALIDSWRARFAAPSLWFGVWLLQPWTWDEQTLPELRLSQVAVAQNAQNAHLASCIDTGDLLSPYSTVHTRDKQRPGARMAAALLATLLRLPSPPPHLGPTYAAAAVASRSPSRLLVSVAFAPETLQRGLALNTSLQCPQGVLAINPALCAGFEVGTSDGAWHAASAALGTGGDTLELAVEPSPEGGGVLATATRGYYAAWPIVTLRNGAGLPANPWQANFTAQ